MSGDPQLFRVNPESQQSERIEEVDFARLGLRERRDIQEWVAANPGILGDDLLMIGKEFSGFDQTSERLDLLAVDLDGRLVIIELKRDDTGSDVHWQAIKYASYFQRATADALIGVASDYWKESPEDAETRLFQHLGADDLNALNNDQRIILASHRFAPEVTSAALWINQKVPTEDLITCVRLTPYRDAQTDSLYVQATTIIPIPEAEQYLVNIDSNALQNSRNRSAPRARSRDDEVDVFIRKAVRLAIDELPGEIKPNQQSRRAGNADLPIWGKVRWFHLWYTRRPPWRNHGISYRIHLAPTEAGQWAVFLRIAFLQSESDLGDAPIHPQQSLVDIWGGKALSVPIGIGDLGDDFAQEVAANIRPLIEQITPIIDDWGG